LNVFRQNVTFIKWGWVFKYCATCLNQNSQNLRIAEFLILDVIARNETELFAELNDAAIP